jgi:hypothetical protein
MQSRRAALRLSTLLVLVPVAAHGGGFEGTLRWREVRVSRTALEKLLGAEGAVDSTAVFAVPSERIAALAGSPGVEVAETLIHVRGQMVRVDLPADGNAAHMIMDLANTQTLVVMPGKRQVLELNRREVESVGKGMGALEKALRKHAADLPPAKRERIESMMHDTVGAGTAPEARPLGRTERINGMEAAGYELRLGKDLTRGWVTQDHPDLIAAFRAVQAGRAQMKGKGAKGPLTALTKRGLPVRVQTLARGRYELGELTEIRREPVLEQTFAVDPAFERVTPYGLIGDAIRTKPTP